MAEFHSPVCNRNAHLGRRLPVRKGVEETHAYSQSRLCKARKQRPFDLVAGWEAGKTSGCYDLSFGWTLSFFVHVTASQLREQAKNTVQQERDLD